MHTIGPHTSIAGGLEQAILSAVELNANAFGMFTKNQRQWKAKPITEEQAKLFHSTLLHYGFGKKQVLVHDSYLINLAHPDPTKRQISIHAFIDELKRVETLGLELLNFHPGSHLGQGEPKDALKLVAESIDRALEETQTAVAVIENTAGQGTNLGSRFEELATILEQSHHPERIGICIDTCHAHAVGYDMAGIDAFEKAIQRFDSLIGLSFLKGMHLNDSKGILASHVDRHASLGLGTIGWETFEYIARDARFACMPLILETVDSTRWKEEVAHLRRFDA